MIMMIYVMWRLWLKYSLKFFKLSLKLYRYVKCILIEATENAMNWYKIIDVRRRSPV